jgi:hypothetical protein
MRKVTGSFTIQRRIALTWNLLTSRMSVIIRFDRLTKGMEDFDRTADSFTEGRIGYFQKKNLSYLYADLPDIQWWMLCHSCNAEKMENIHCGPICKLLLKRQLKASSAQSRKNVDQKFASRLHCNYRKVTNVLSYLTNLSWHPVNTTLKYFTQSLRYYSLLSIKYPSKTHDTTND